MPGVFIDTGGWIAVTVENDRFHTVASQYFSNIIAARATILTTNYVLSETYTRLIYDAGHHRAIAFHNIVTEAVRLGMLQVEWITPQIHEAAWHI